jgi:hypothetical protein
MSLNGIAAYDQDRMLAVDVIYLLSEHRSARQIQQWGISKHQSIHMCELIKCPSLRLFLRSDRCSLLFGRHVCEEFNLEATNIFLTTLNNKHQKKKNTEGKARAYLEAEDERYDDNVNDIGCRNQLESLYLVGMSVRRQRRHDGAQTGDSDGKIGNNAEDESSYANVSEGRIEHMAEHIPKEEPSKYMALSDHECNLVRREITPTPIMP